MSALERDQHDEVFNNRTMPSKRGDSSAELSVSGLAHIDPDVLLHGVQCEYCMNLSSKLSR